MEKTNVRLDGITSLGILSAYSHAGLVDEAHIYFSRMRGHHYACLIYVLSSMRRCISCMIRKCSESDCESLKKVIMLQKFCSFLVTHINDSISLLKQRHLS